MTEAPQLTPRVEDEVTTPDQTPSQEAPRELSPHELLAIDGLRSAIDQGSPIRKPYRFARGKLGIDVDQTDFHRQLRAQ